VVTNRTPTTVRTGADVARLGTVLGIWAHPDDEVYLSAGLMAAARAADNRVVVATATRGERGTEDPVGLPPAVLAPLRVRELAASLALLDGGGGGVEHHFLGERTGHSYLDGALGPSERAVGELTELVERVAPDTVVTFGPDGMTGHPDHRAVSAWTDQAIARADVPQPRLLHAVVVADWVREFGDALVPMDDGGDAFPVCPQEHLAVDLDLDTAALDVKIAALRAHASQTEALAAALGPRRYRAAVAAEWFRAAAA
jgi:LmbE family N-acetylglucosaminyl deacetylase